MNILAIFGRRSKERRFLDLVQDLSDAMRTAKREVDAANTKIPQAVSAQPEEPAPPVDAPQQHSNRGISLAGLAAAVPALEMPAGEPQPLRDAFGLAAGAWVPPSPDAVRQFLHLNLFREFFSGQLVEESHDAETGEWHLTMSRRLSNGERQAGRRHLQRAGVRATVREVGGDTWSEPARLSWPRPGTTETVAAGTIQVTDTLRRDYGD